MNCRYSGHKLKYLGCFFNQNCTVDYSNSVQKFYGNFNNILSALGHNRNEISAVHLVKSYCIPSLLYACEIWTLGSSDYHKMNVICNNAFSALKFFNAAGVKVFHVYFTIAKSCQCLILLIDQRKLLFLKKIQT